jgi:hypothetical protein
LQNKYIADLSLTDEWLLFRRRCDLLAVKRRSLAGDEKGAREGETIGHEESPKMTRLAREHTIAYHVAVRSLWKHLYTGVPHR